MPITAFVAAVGFIGAIVILRTNQWVKYKEESHCVSAFAFGLIWSYCSVLIGIIAIVWASFKTVFFDATNPNPTVLGIPLSLLYVMAFMAFIDLQPVLATILKAILGISNEISFLEYFHADEIIDQGYVTERRVVGRNGKIFIFFVVFFILVMVFLAIFISSVWFE